MEETTLPFDLGSSDDHINSINADGVALAVIKRLTQKVERQQSTIDSLKRQVRSLQAVEQNRMRLARQVAALKQSRSGVLPASWG